MNLANRLRSLRSLALHDRLLYAHVGVTHRCNMRCRMCTVPERGDVNREADPAAFRRVARELAQVGCMMASLGGGEPFLRKDLPGIVEAFASEGIRVRVLTNGITATRRTLTEVAEAGATDVSMSLDSLDPVIQARIEAMEGVFPRKMETLAGVVAEFPRHAVHIINAVVTPQTLPGLPDVARFAESIGFLSSFIPIHLEPEHHFFSNERSLSFRGEHEAMLRGFYADLVRRRRRGGVVNSRVYLDNSLKYLLGEPFDWDCHAGVLYVSVGPDARISICHQWEDTDTVPAEGFAERYLRGDWRRQANAKSSPCRACYRPCWAEIDHLVFDAEAFMGALRLKFSGAGHPGRELSAEEITQTRERILAEGRAPGSPAACASGFA